MATVYLGVPIVGGEVHLYDPYTEPTSTGVVAPTDSDMSVTKPISLNIFKSVFKRVSRKLYTKREK